MPHRSSSAARVESPRHLTMAGAWNSRARSSINKRSESAALTDVTMEMRATQNEYFARRRQSKACTSIVAANCAAWTAGRRPSCVHRAMASLMTAACFRGSFIITSPCEWHRDLQGDHRDPGYGRRKRLSTEWRNLGDSGEGCGCGDVVTQSPLME